MDSGDRRQVDKNIQPIMKVPEETMCIIFSYLPFETLYFSLRKVCTKIQNYVDRYIKIGGASPLVVRHPGSSSEVIAELPKKGFIVVQKPVSSFPCVTSILQDSTSRCFSRYFKMSENYCDRRISILQNDMSLDLHGDRIVDKVVYGVMGENVVCYIYNSLEGLTYRFDLENDKWENFLERFTAIKFFEPMHVWNEYNEHSHKCTPKLVWKEFPYHFRNHNFSHYNYPFVQFKTNGGKWTNCTMISYKRLQL